MPADPPSESPDDPFAWLTLDENFIAAARRAEPSAAERDRAARQADLRRRLADEQQLQRDQDQLGQRYAATVAEGRDPRERSSIRSRALAFLLVATVAGGVLWQWQRSDTAAEFLGGSAFEGAARPTDWPSAADASPVPLGAPSTTSMSVGPHEFVGTQPDTISPIAYDPCREIHYVTRPGGPVEGQQLIREAVAAVSAATGLVFVDDGITDEAPTDQRLLYQPDRYGDRWAPVLIVWSDPAESPRLGVVDPADPLVDVAGFAGSAAVGPPTTADAPAMVYVTGSVTLDTADFRTVLSRPDGVASARAIVQHELGHLVGLDHVDDPAQLMHGKNSGLVTDYQAGDLQGLAALGSGECFPEA